VPQKQWSTKLVDFVANSGRPEYREQATREKNGIAPMDLGGAIGIGTNHQRKTWFLLGAALFFGLLALMALTVGPPRLRALMRTRVDPQLFGYWEQFRQAIEPRS
jgi:hypothetical protein